MVVSRAGQVLSALIAILAVIASVGGLVLDGLYRDNAFVASTWLGNDVVTLAVAVPLLLAALFLAKRGSARAYLVWLGLLDTMLYNFCFYLFAAAFNWFFMLYAAIVALSIWALLVGLTGLNTVDLQRRFRAGTSRRVIAGYMLLVGFCLAAVYVGQWLGFVLGGQVPAIIVKTQHPTNAVFALDLTLVIPFLIVGALWLWRQRGWGYVVAAIINIKGAVYMLGLCAATLTAYWAGTIESAAEIGLWGSIGLGSLLSVFFLLKNLDGNPFPDEFHP